MILWPLQLLGTNGQPSRETPTRRKDKVGYATGAGDPGKDTENSLWSCRQLRLSQNRPD